MFGNIKRRNYMKKLTLLCTLILVGCGGKEVVKLENCIDGACNPGVKGDPGESIVGPKGDNGIGIDGLNGLNSLIDFERVGTLTDLCSAGTGLMVYSGLDRDLDLLLSNSERMKTSFVCDGKVGNSGNNGVDGSSCSVTSIVGGVKITCGSSIAYVNNGVNGLSGTSCSVSDTVTGAKITCTDGTTQTIFDGEDGIDGTSSTTSYNLYTLFTKTSSNSFNDTGACINIGEGLSARYYGIHAEGNRVTKVFNNTTCTFVGSPGYVCSLHPNGDNEATGADGDEICWIGSSLLVIDVHENENNGIYRLTRITF